MAQRTIIVLDDATGKEQNYAWVELLRNGYEPITEEWGGWKSDYLNNLREGVVISDSDSLFFALYNSQYMPVWEKIDVNSTDTLFIHLVKNPVIPLSEFGVVPETCRFLRLKNFNPRVIPTLKDVPEEHQKIILEYLQHYVGEELASLVKIFRIYSMYSNQLNEVNYTNSYQPNELIYDVCFYYTDNSLGIDWYSTSMEISTTGKVYKFPGLPYRLFLGSLEQSAIPVLSKDQILEIVAQKPRFDPKNTTINFTFSQRAGVFIWKVKESRIGRNGLTFVTETHYDAVSGEILSTFFDRLDIISDRIKFPYM